MLEFFLYYMRLKLACSV